MMKNTLLAISLSGLLSLSLSAQSLIPDELNYQASVTDEFGVAVADGSYGLKLRIFDAVTVGNLIWSEQYTVRVFKGNFSVILGQGTDIIGDTPAETSISQAFAGAERYVEITLDNGTPKTFVPRQKMVATATSFRAKVAESLADGVLTEAAFPPLGFSGAVLQGNAITSDKVADGTIVGADLANNTLTSAQIGADAIGSSELADGAVGTANLQNSSITSDKIGTGQVETSDLKDGSVTAAKLAPTALNGFPLADNSVTSEKIFNGEVKTVDLDDNAVTNAKLAADAVDTVQLVDGAVTSAKIVDGTVQTTDLADGAVTRPKLSPGLGAPVMLPPSDAKAIWNNKTVDGGGDLVLTKSEYSLPSGINGVIFKALISKKGSGNTALVFNSGLDAGGNLAFPSVNPFQANSLVNYNLTSVTAETIWEQGTLWVPTKEISDTQYQVKYEAVDASSGSSSWTDKSFKAYLSIIGYY